LLKWLNLMLYPSKHGDRHQNYSDIMHSDWDIDERKIFRNGGLNLHTGGLPTDDRVASFRFLKNTPRRYGNSKKALHGRYCTLIGPCHRTITSFWDCKSDASFREFKTICYFVLVRNWLFRYCDNKTKYRSKIDIEREARSAVSQLARRFVSLQAS